MTHASSGPFAGSKVVLVQLRLRDGEKPPAASRKRDPSTTRIRNGSVASSTEVLSLCGASGEFLPDVLQAGGLSLVDVYHDERHDKLGRPYTLLTFLFGREPNSERQAQLEKERAATFLVGYLVRRWDYVTLNHLSSMTDESRFHSVVFAGQSEVEIDPSRRKVIEDEDAQLFGLAEIRSKGKPSKPRVAA